MDCTLYVAKTKTLISCAVARQLICTFAYAYAKAGFLKKRLNCPYGAMKKPTPLWTYIFEGKHWIQLLL